jgi:hypothetical protein
MGNVENRFLVHAGIANGDDDEKSGSPMLQFWRKNEESKKQGGPPGRPVLRRYSVLTD